MHESLIPIPTLSMHQFTSESVMHYGPNSFAIDRSKPTITPISSAVEIGQRRGFSEVSLSIADHLKLSVNNN